jgi:hypothetical protein
MWVRVSAGLCEGETVPLVVEGQPGSGVLSPQHLVILGVGLQLFIPS